MFRSRVRVHPAILESDRRDAGPTRVSGRALIVVALLVLALAPARARAASKPIEACVPADAMGVYFSRPSAQMADPGDGGAIENIGRWLIMLKTMGLLPEQGRVIADVVGTLPLLASRPHALVLLDITARQLGPGSYRLNDMQTALVVDSTGIGVELDRRVRDLLATYADAKTGRVEPITAGDTRYYRLTDSRLPKWAVTEWGTINGHFVVGFGAGAFEKVLATARGTAPALADDDWYAPAHVRCSAITSGIEIYVAVARIEERLERIIDEKVRATLRAAHLDRADRVLLTIGFDGRALHSELLVRERNGQDHHKLLTGKEVAAPEVLAAIPDEAHSFAAFRLPLGELIRQGREAYLKTQSEDRRERLSQGWARLETQFNFDVEAGLFDQLGDHLIFHTFPQHPLGIPLLGTVWIQIDGNRDRVARTIDGMMLAWQEYANHPAAGPQPRFRLTPQIRQDPDGVWYLQLGLLGPALAVTDDWIVISFSPEAVRENVTYLQGVRPPADRPREQITE